MLFKLIKRLSLPTLGIADNGEGGNCFCGIAFSTSVRSFVISCFNKSKALIKSKLFSPTTVSLFKFSSSSSKMLKSVRFSLESSDLTIVIVSILFFIVFKTSSISGFYHDESFIKSENLL